MAVNFQIIFAELAAASVDDLGYESGGELVDILEMDGGYDSGFEEADWVIEDDGDEDDDEDEDEDEGDDDDDDEDEDDDEGEEDGPEEDWDFEIDWMCTVMELPFVD